MIKLSYLYENKFKKELELKQQIPVRYNVKFYLWMAAFREIIRWFVPYSAVE